MADDILGEIRASKKKFYVYILRKPDGTPFYVGLGRGRRILKHEWMARITSKNIHRLNIIRQILASGQEVGKSFDSWHDDLRSASDREISLILELGREDLGTGPLVNQTSGGNLTWKIGKAGRKAASRLTKEQFRNPERREKQRQALRRYFSNPEAIEALAAMTKERLAAPEARKRMSVARRKFNQNNPLLAAANDVVRLAGLRKPEARARAAANSRKRMADNPELQPAMVLAALTPEAKAKHSASQKKRFEKPEERRKAMEASAAWRKERSVIVEVCRRLLSKHGLVPPSGKASFKDWREFEERIRLLTKDYENVENAR